MGDELSLVTFTAVALLLIDGSAIRRAMEPGAACAAGGLALRLGERSIAD